MGAFSISKTLKKGFEGLNGKMSDYNAFIQANMNVVKALALEAAPVVAPVKEEMILTTMGMINR